MGKLAETQRRSQGPGGLADQVFFSLGIQGLRDLPGFVVAFVLVWVGLDIALHYAGLDGVLRAVDSRVAPLALPAVAIVITLVLYSLGELIVPPFDSKYSIKGSWGRQEARVAWGLLPGGADLNAVRKQAEAVVGPGPGVYRRCRYLLEQSEDPRHRMALTRADNFRAQARVCQTLCPPAIAIGLTVIVLGCVAITMGSGQAAQMLAAGVLVLAVASCLLVAFFNIRVQHMYELYEAVGGPQKAVATAPAGVPAADLKAIRD